MISPAIRPFASLKWPPALKLPDGVRFPANFGDLVTLHHQLSSFFQPASGVSIISYFLYSVSAFIAFTVLAWIFLNSDRKSKFKVPVAEVNEKSPEGMPSGPMDGNGELGAINDTPCAEEIEFQETLMASIFNLGMSYNPSLSPQNHRNLDKEVETSLQESFCKICLENKDSWQMFVNGACSHSFCYECTSAHISAKIQDQAKEIACPAVNCTHVLSHDDCRLMIPNDVLVQWDESLCMSLILESQKLYCPFRDCSALLVKDSSQTVTQVRCLVCDRVFCAECRVPWHSDFTCKEFQKLNGRKRGKDDKIVKALAKKKNWKKCPKCKMYVEKADGCVHITCRCSYEFCYRCGRKWTGTHGNCPRPRWWAPFPGK